jgi:hypothetical protein
MSADRSDALAADLAAGRFEPLLLEIPCLVVGTDDGYAPDLDDILAFASPNRPAGADHSGPHSIGA